MSENTVCNLCQNPGTYSDSNEVARIPCHVDCFKDHVFTVWRCNNCLSLHCKNDPNLGFYYDKYPFKKHTLDYHTRWGYRNRIRLLRKFGLRSHHRILDYGCGKGLFVQTLKSAGYTHAAGYDPLIPEYSDPGILTELYDVLVSFDVIEHVPEPDAYLKELASMLKPGGLLILGTPNAEDLSLAKGKELTVELSQPYHRHILSARALFSLVERNNLTVISVYRRFYFDTLAPFVNTRFMWKYIGQLGGMIDVAVERLKLGVVLRSPKLLFYGLFGYFFPQPGNILLALRKNL